MELDMRHRVRGAFQQAGRPIADDVLDELTEHAETVLQACRDAGASHAACWAEVEREVAGWVADAPCHARQPLSAPTPPAANHRETLTEFVRDLIYAARLLRRQPAAPVLSIATITLGITAVAL